MLFSDDFGMRKNIFYIALSNYFKAKQKTRDFFQIKSKLKNSCVQTLFGKLDLLVI